ncbi:MAG: hypothetical protein ACTHKR_12960 [Sphingomonas sp.]
MSRPTLAAAQRQELVDRLMAARRAIAQAQQQSDPSAVAAARETVNRIKIALGERGPVWWDDDAPDLNRRLAKNTPYAAWFASLPGG